MAVRGKKGSIGEKGEERRGEGRKIHDVVSSAEYSLMSKRDRIKIRYGYRVLPLPILSPDHSTGNTDR